MVRDQPLVTLKCLWGHHFSFALFPFIIHLISFCHLDIAKTNKRSLTEDQKKEISTILDHLEHDCDEKLNFLHLFKSGQTGKTIILCLCWATTSIAHYALAFNQTKLAGDIFLNYLLFTIFDSIGRLIQCRKSSLWQHSVLIGSVILYFTLDSLGRRWMLSLSLSTLGTSSVILAFIPKSSGTVILIFYLLGKLSAGVSFAMVWFVTGELYPTNLRAQVRSFNFLFSPIIGKDFFV